MLFGRTAVGVGVRAVCKYFQFLAKEIPDFCVSIFSTIVPCVYVCVGGWWEVRMLFRRGSPLIEIFLWCLVVVRSTVGMTMMVIMRDGRGGWW